MTIKSFNPTKYLLICGLILLTFSCKKDKKPINPNDNIRTMPNKNKKDMKYKYSLAQWSLHKLLFDSKIDPMDFAKDAKKLGFSGLEYVSQLYVGDRVSYPYKDKSLDEILKELKRRSDSLGMENLIVMVDGEGDLSFNDEKQTAEAVENHKKWIDAAAFLGCHSIRINLFGESQAEDWVKNSVRSLKALIEYSEPKGISILVENHGGLSSDAALLARVMKEVGSKFCGTLPDFGNFCVKREGGARWQAPCVETYDMYKGIDELMPFAKGVSAKSYDFDENGNETKIDYKKMMSIVGSHNFEGYIGVEYEGDDPINGIKATKALLEKCIDN